MVCLQLDNAIGALISTSSRSVLQYSARTEHVFDPGLWLSLALKGPRMKEVGESSSASDASLSGNPSHPLPNSPPP